MNEASENEEHNRAETSGRFFWLSGGQLDKTKRWVKHYLGIVSSFRRAPISSKKVCGQRWGLIGSKCLTSNKICVPAMNRLFLKFAKQPLKQKSCRKCNNSFDSGAIYYSTRRLILLCKATCVLVSERSS